MKIYNKNKKMYMLLFFAMIVVLLVFKIIYIRREYIYLNTDYSVYVVMFMPFAIYYALKYVDNITSATALNWLCTVPMSMYLYQSVYLRFKQFDMLIVYSLMGIFINLIVFKKNIQKARELYKRAAQLGERTAKENWILFNISFPTSYIELIEILKQGYEDKSKIVSEFVESYFPKNSNHTLKEFFMLEQSQQEKILKMQQYELECSEEVAKNIGKEFVSSKKIKSKKINVEVGENVVEYTFNELGNYLSRKKVISEVKSYYLTYYQKVFYFSAKNKTSYITI